MNKFSLNINFVFEPVRESFLAVDIKNEEIYILNELGYKILDNLVKSRSVYVTEELEKEFNSDLLAEYVNELINMNILIKE